MPGRSHRAPAALRSFNFLKHPLSQTVMGATAARVRQSGFHPHAVDRSGQRERSRCSDCEVWRRRDGGELTERLRPISSQDARSRGVAKSSAGDRRHLICACLTCAPRPRVGVAPPGLTEGSNRSGVSVASHRRLLL
jgi:hypothetical protein